MGPVPPFFLYNPGAGSDNCTSRHVSPISHIMDIILDAAR